MKKIHYIFFFLFAQSIFIIGIYMSFLILLFYYSLKLFITRKIKKYTFIFLIPFIYWILNLFLFSEPAQLLNLEFYRYDGKFIPVFVILLLLLNSIYYKDFIEYIKKLKFLVFLIWIMTIIGFIPFLNISLFESHNANAGFIGSIIIVNIIILFRFNHVFKFNKVFLFGITLYFLLLFVNYFSRAFFLGLVISLFFLFFFERKNHNLKNIVSFFFILIIFSIFTSLFSSIPERFILAIKEPGEDWNVITRIAIWQLAINLWFSNFKTFFFGIGIGLFNDITTLEIYKDNIIDKFYFGERHSHNIILHLLVEQGLLGLILFFSPFIYIYRKLKTIYSKTRSEISAFNLQVFLTLFIYLFVASQFGLNFFTPSTSIIFYIFLANIISTLKLEVTNYGKT